MKRTIDSRNFRGTVVELKFSDDRFAQEAGRSWYAVVGGKPNFPKKEDGVTDEQSARAWLNATLRKAGLLTK